MTFDDAQTEAEIVSYRQTLLALIDRYAAGARSLVAVEAQQCSDALICLLEEAPLARRQEIDYLIDRYEALRLRCLS